MHSDGAPATPSAPAVPTTTSASPESPYDPPPASTTTAPGVARGGHSIELGAAFGVTIASDVRDLSATLAAGKFVADRFELSALASVAHVKAGAQAATLWSTLIEPAYHLPLAPAMSAMLGMGVGLAYNHELGTGFAVAPRIGVRFLVGRFGVLTPALSYAYVTHRALDPADDLAVLAVAGALRIQLGYAVRW